MANYDNLLANVPTDLWIGGKWRKASDGGRFDVIDPATERKIASVASATVDDAKAALDAAEGAFEGWAGRKPRERAEILRKAYELIMRDAERFAKLITLENGKALPDSRGEVAYAAEFFRWYAEEAVRNVGEVSRAPASGARIFVHHKPAGIAVLVTPWNFPAAMATRKIGPALAAGCPVVLKPASDTPLTMLALMPALEEAGVTFVDDVSPYELMKIRILNGGHAAIAYPAALMDIHFVHEAMEEPLIRNFLAKLEREEIIPTVPPVPGTDIDDYFKLIERRFSNPKIGDTIPRLCQDGSNRQPKFILPAAAARLAAGAGITGLSLVSALWCRFCAGTTDSGKPTNYTDASAERLKQAALRARESPAAFLALGDIFGEVGKSEVFAASFARHLKALSESGTREVLARYASGNL